MSGSDSRRHLRAARGLFAAAETALAARLRPQALRRRARPARRRADVLDAAPPEEAIRSGARERCQDGSRHWRVLLRPFGLSRAGPSPRPVKARGRASAVTEAAEMTRAARWSGAACRRCRSEQ